jgi:hypothetical protein
MLIAPASLKDQAIAASEGTLQTLIDAGAKILPRAAEHVLAMGKTLKKTKPLFLALLVIFKAAWAHLALKCFLVPHTPLLLQRFGVALLTRGRS